MPINSDGVWVPLLSPKQFELFNCYKKYVLVSGPRRSSKTVGCLNKILRHCWETPMARVAIFARTRKSADQGGVFTDLIETILPPWLEANIGMRVCTGPKNAPTPLTDGGTRILYFDVSNVHGNKSRVQLHSLDYDFDVEAAVRGTRFSLIFFSELSNFKNRIVFTVTAEQLRCPHLREDQHQFLADCNPSEEGESSWIHRLFYKERLMENHPYPSEQQRYALFEFFIDDNPFLSEEEKIGIKARHAHDPDLYSRFVLGKWTRRTEAGLFSDVFNHETHVLGNCDSMNEEDWELLLPTENVSKMLTGWDPGSSKNHSCHILEKTGNVFHVLDEIVSLGINLPTADFTAVVMQRMEFWKAFIRDCCHTNPVEWRHWSDSSAFEQFRAGGGALGNFDHNIIAMASEGEIMLTAAPKGKGSIFKRIDIVRRLLFQNRLFVSARCVKTIEMLGGICKGKSSVEPVEDSPLRHIFDSLSYAIAAEAMHELYEDWSPRIAPAGNIVSIKL